MAVKKFRFTNRGLDALPPCATDSPSKADEYSDSEVIGLKITVTKQRRKVFYFRAVVDGVKKAIRIGEYPAISLHEARDRALEHRAVIDRGGNPSESRDRLKTMPTFAEFSDREYLPHVRSYKRSADADASKLALHLVPRFGKLRLAEISTRDVQMYHNDISRKLSPSTANRHLALISHMLNLAVQWDRLVKNPALGIKKFQEKVAHLPQLKLDDLGPLFSAMEREQNQVAVAALKLLLFTGVRREEALKARWEHIDLKGRTWFLPHTKSGHSRYVQLNDEALVLLEKQPRTGSAFVFPGRDPKKPLNNPRKAFTRVLNACGLGHMRIHSLRHAHCSFAVEAGASLYQVQEMVGHRSASTTARYAHISNKTVLATAQLVSSAISAATNQKGEAT